MLYEFKGFGGCDSVCDIEVRGNVVIATELSSNEGTSITNKAEDLIVEVASKFGISLHDLVWIEHYTRENGYHEDYSRVWFNIRDYGVDGLRWEHIKEDIDEYIAKLS